MENLEFNKEVLEEYDFFIDKLMRKEPFAFAHFNDGEMQYILNKSEGAISRGAQDYNVNLAMGLKEAFLTPNSNFYRGVPCWICYPDMRREAEELIKEREDMPTTPACVFHHNYLKQRNILFESILKYENMTWVTNDVFDLKKVLHEIKSSQIETNQNEIRHVRIPIKNGYEKYEKIKNMEYKDGELVFYLCGPLGRILAAESSVKYPKTTFLCLGSYFDNISNDEQHSYFFDDKLCKGCCPP